MVKGIIFDLDGVLVDTADQHFLSWVFVAEGLGFSLDTSLKEDLKGISRMSSLNIVLDAGGLIIDEKEKLALTDKKNEWFINSLDELPDGVVLPGVVPFLEKLTSLGIPLGVGSASKNAHLILTKLGMTHYFKTIIDGNTVLKSKPDPEVFIDVARDLQLLEEDCLVFEDSHKGIKAALTGGFRVIGIGNPDHLQEAHHVITDFIGHDWDSIQRLID